jgi:uncharacterized protein DUF6755
MRQPRFIRSQRSIIVSGILAIVLIILILQLWLFSATMDAFLRGDHGILIPAAIASAVCLLLNAGLLWYLYALEK